MRFIDLQKQYQAYKDEIDTGMSDVVENSNFIMGPQINELEEKLAQYVGCEYAISCASGTDALWLALLAFGVKEGDEIITTAFSFIATAEIISLVGAKPVFVDICEDTYNLDPEKVRESITNKTKGIIAVNLFGQCADYDAVSKIAKDHSLFVVEDAAQSFGAAYKGKKSGMLADLGCTSFFPAKPLGCFGDGGMVFTGKEPLAEIIKSMRTHGSDTKKYNHKRIGTNSRLDTIQAAVLLAKFDHFEDEIKARQKIAKRYTEKLDNSITTPKIAEDNLSVYAQYSIRARDRDKLQGYLEDEGIPTAIHYPAPLPFLEAFSSIGYREGDFPVAESVSKDIISLPMHPFLDHEDQDMIINKVNSFYQP